MARVCVVATALVTLPGPGHAQDVTVRKSDIVRILGQLPEFTPIREDMRALGFEGEKLDLAVAQIERMLRDPLIASNIADRVIAARLPNVDTVEAGGLFWPLVDRGLGRLNPRELRYFYVVEQAMLKALPTRECGLTIKERLAPERLAKVTGSVAARLNTPALKEYYRIQFKAAQFGASQEVFRLAPAAEAKAAETINRALGRTLADRPDRKALMRAYRNLNRVGNRRACEAGRLFMDAVLSLEGRELHNALILLSTP
ncbi:hypothetical protein [Roseovarius sp. MMSF_3305]|nr:hypothetical protein [Roseovarius sp. MMSF_3305]